MCIANSNGFNMEWALEAKEKHKQKKIQHLATSNELMGRCTIECFIIVTKRCFFLGTLYSNAYGD
jgi:hypothetical protein